MPNHGGKPVRSHARWWISCSLLLILSLASITCGKKSSQGITVAVGPRYERTMVFYEPEQPIRLGEMRKILGLGILFLYGPLSTTAGERSALLDVNGRTLLSDALLPAKGDLLEIGLLDVFGTVTVGDDLLNPSLAEAWLNFNGPVAEGIAAVPLTCELAYGTGTGAATGDELPAGYESMPRKADKQGYPKLSQFHKSSWGENYCVPTSAAMALARYAAEQPTKFGKLIKERAPADGVISDEERYDLVEELAGLMYTHPELGTLPSSVLAGLLSLLHSRGLSDQFVIKSFRPRNHSFGPMVDALVSSTAHPFRPDGIVAAAGASTTVAAGRAKAESEGRKVLEERARALERARQLLAADPSAEGALEKAADGLDQEIQAMKTAVAQHEEVINQYNGMSAEFSTKFKATLAQVKVRDGLKARRDAETDPQVKAQLDQQLQAAETELETKKLAHMAANRAQREFYITNNIADRNKAVRDNLRKIKAYQDVAFQLRTAAGLRKRQAELDAHVRFIDTGFGPTPERLAQELNDCESVFLLLEKFGQQGDNVVAVGGHVAIAQAVLMDNSVTIIDPQNARMINMASVVDEASGNKHRFKDNLGRFRSEPRRWFLVPVGASYNESRFWVKDMISISEK